MGEVVYYTGRGKTWPDGDKLVQGQKGEVKGPATGKKTTGKVNVLFAGNKCTITCFLTNVSRAAAAVEKAAAETERASSLR